MSLPTSLTTFIAALQSYQDVAKDTVAARIAALRGRLQVIENSRLDDLERIEARTKERIEHLRSNMTGEIARLREEASSDKDLIAARRAQDREIIEQQIGALEALNDSLIVGTAPAEPKLDFPTGRHDELFKDDAPLGNGPIVDFNAKPALPKAKDGPPIWRGKKPLTQMTDAELDETIAAETPSQPHLPEGVYVSEGNFYSMISHKGMGDKFYKEWRERADEFQRDPRITAERAVPRFSSIETNYVQPKPESD